MTEIQVDSNLLGGNLILFCRQDKAEMTFVNVGLFLLVSSFSVLIGFCLTFQNLISYIFQHAEKTQEQEKGLVSIPTPL